MPQKELPLVALLRQEKLAFLASGLSAAIGAITPFGLKKVMRCNFKHKNNLFKVFECSKII